MKPLISPDHQRSSPQPLISSLDFHLYTNTTLYNALNSETSLIQFYPVQSSPANNQPTMRLAHLHLPHITPFTRVSQIQETLTSRLLAAKNHRGPGHPPPPDPTIITFTPNPVYTTGRRDLPPSNTRNTTKPPASRGGGAQLSLPAALEPIRSLLTAPSTTSEPARPRPDAVAEYHPTLRGGQTTYHGPGQLVAYTVLDLRRHGLTPRCHIRVLEDSVVDVLRGFGVRGLITDDPGVWVAAPSKLQSPPSTEAQAQAPSQAGPASGVEVPKKITAVGVHLRRNISSYGIGLNVSEEPMWYFRQIVACGLEGREATSLEEVGVSGVSVDDVAGRFVRAFVERVNRGSDCAKSYGNGMLWEEVDSVYRIGEGDV
jgi:lipoate-protein ligase B